MICESAMDWSEAAAVPEDDAGRLARRDPRALTPLIERYQHRLYGYLLRMVRDASAAEDLFQQTWLRVVERIGSYDRNRSFESWLFSIAHNTAVDWLRRKRSDALDPGAEPCDTDAVSSLERLLAAEREATLSAEVDLLPAAWRETLVLRFEEGMKLDEIAQTVGAPLSTVKSRLRRALEHLRRRLGPVWGEDA
jgi:RNA polymerase sigma-70 factor (ECF subfamily)